MNHNIGRLSKVAFYMLISFLLGCSGSGSSDEKNVENECRDFASQYIISIDKDEMTSITLSCSWLEANSSIECYSGAGKYSDTIYGSPQEFVNESNPTGLLTKLEAIRYSRGIAGMREVYEYNTKEILIRKTEYLEMTIPPTNIAEIEFVSHDEAGRPLNGFISQNSNIERCNATEVQYVYDDAEMTLVTTYTGGPGYTGGIDCKFIDTKIQYDEDNNKLSETYLALDPSESFIYTITATDEVCAIKSQ
jgi:hypothetical protein